MTSMLTTLLDPRFRLGYYSLRYVEDPGNKEDPEDILQFARHVYKSGYKTSVSDAANTEPQSCISNDFKGRMLKKPRTAVVTSIE